MLCTKRRYFIHYHLENKTSKWFHLDGIVYHPLPLDALQAGEEGFSSHSLQHLSLKTRTHPTPLHGLPL